MIGEGEIEGNHIVIDRNNIHRSQCCNEIFSLMYDLQDGCIDCLDSVHKGYVIHMLILGQDLSFDKPSSLGV